MNICVFAGSSSGVKDDYLAAATELGKALADAGIGLVYGGAHIGLMGAVADGALSRDGYVVGVIPQAIADIEVAHDGLSELHIVDSMHTRKAMMAEHSSAFIALPGGIGTLEELFEIWTWTQLGIHSKALGVLNIANYYDKLLDFVDHVQQEGFVKAPHRQLLVSDESPVQLIQKLEQFKVSTTSKL